MVTFISHSPAQTAALGEQWGREARPGWIIGLSGGLGAGKTILAARPGARFGRDDARAIAHFCAWSTSTATAGCRCSIWTFIVWPRASDIIAAGLEALPGRPEGVAVVEWIESWLEEESAPLAPGVICVASEIKTAGETGREIKYEDFGG